MRGLKPVVCLGLMSAITLAEASWEEFTAELLELLGPAQSAEEQQYNDVYVPCFVKHYYQRTQRENPQMDPEFWKLVASTDFVNASRRGTLRQIAHELVPYAISDNVPLDELNTLLRQMCSEMIQEIDP